MKRTLTCLFILLFLMNFAALGAEHAVLEVDSAALPAGTETVTLDVTLEGGSGSCGGSFILWYDSTCLELTGLEAGSAVDGAVTALNPHLGDGVAKMSWVSLASLAENGVVARLTFRVLQEESTAVELLNPELLDAAGAALPLQSVNGQVSFPAPPQSTSEPLPGGGTAAPPSQSGGSTPSPGGEITPPSTPTENLGVWENPFSDVPENAWFYDAVAFAYQRGLFSGTSETTFSPELPMDRAMLAMVLYRLEGGTAESGVLDAFDDWTDIPDWAVSGLAWAVEQGVLYGSGGSLTPNGTLTREMLAAMFFRHAGAEAGDRRVLDAFADGASVSPWAADAMVWAVEIGLLQGRAGGLLSPAGIATRAEVAAVLERLLAG